MLKKNSKPSFDIYIYIYFSCLSVVPDDGADILLRSIWGISGVAHFPSVHTTRGAWIYGDKRRIVFEEDIIDRNP